MSSSAGTSDRVLVTGGAGFVGRHLIGLLTAAGRRVMVFDDLSAGLPMPEARPGLSCRQGDVRMPEAVAAAFDAFAPDAVIHLAALHHIPSCEADPRRAMDINVLGFQTILDACAARECRRVVLASSGAVYGWAAGALAEDAAVAPRDVYAASKAANEHQLTAWAARTGGAGAIARLFNLIGPNDPNGHLIPDILGRLLKAQENPKLRLRLGNLHTRRDFVDVEDAAGGLTSLLDKAAWAPGAVEIYNLCSGREHSTPDIAHALAAGLGFAIEIFSDPALCRPLDRPSQLGEPAKTARALGWRAGIPLNESLARIVASFGDGSRCG